MKKYIILILLVLTTGCVNEDRDRCDYNISFSLSYVVDVDGDDLFTQNLNTISIHLFNENNKYVYTKVENINSIIDNDYMMTIPITEPGTYKVVVIGDADEEDYVVESDSRNSTLSKMLIPNITNLEDFRVNVKHNNGLINDELGNFFIGSPDDILVDGIEKQIVEVTMTKNTKNIHLTINGLSLVSDHHPIIRCTNGTYNAENSIPDNSEEITYKPYARNTTTRGASNVFTTSMLRIVDGIPMPLSVGNEIIEKPMVDLVTLIKLNPRYRTQMDLDSEDEFYLTLNYGEDAALISVSINSWEHVFVKPEA